MKHEPIEHSAPRHGKHAPRRIGALAWPTVSAAAVTLAVVSACGGSDDPAAQQAALVEQGKQIFRFDTFGDEAQWTDALRMHEVISAAVDPATALSVGLKVDMDALPAAVVKGIQDGSVDLHSPATTVALLKLNAVVGIQGTVETVNGADKLTHVGITCALCHSTVDDAFAPGIGKRLDGWPNRDLDPGAIIALSPALDAATKAALNAWGPGKFDPRHNVDGLSKPVVILRGGCTVKSNGTRLSPRRSRPPSSSSGSMTRAKAPADLAVAAAPSNAARVRALSPQSTTGPRGA